MLAAEAGLPVHGLAAREALLEDVFTKITHNVVEYEGAKRVAAEWIKVRSLRSTYVSVLAATVLVNSVGWVMAHCDTWDTALITTRLSDTSDASASSHSSCWSASESAR